MHLFFFKMSAYDDDDERNNNFIPLSQTFIVYLYIVINYACTHENIILTVSTVRSGGEQCQSRVFRGFRAKKKFILLLTGSSL